MPFTASLRPKQLEALPDVDHNGTPEWAVLGSESPWIEIRDAQSRVLVRKISLNDDFQVPQITVMPDLDGDGDPELAAIRYHPTDGDLRVTVRDPLSGQNLNGISFGTRNEPIKLVALEDLNGNGAPEATLLVRRKSDGTVLAITRDAGTDALVRTINFGPNAQPQDLARIDDINGNGKPELVMLGRRANGTLRAFVRDALTGSMIGSFSF